MEEHQTLAQVQCCYTQSCVCKAIVKNRWKIKPVYSREQNLVFFFNVILVVFVFCFCYSSYGTSPVHCALSIQSLGTNFVTDLAYHVASTFFLLLKHRSCENLYSKILKGHVT